MTERQWVYCAIEGDFESPIDSGIKQCNAKHRVRVALPTANPHHIH